MSHGEEGVRPESPRRRGGRGSPPLWQKLLLALCSLMSLLLLLETAVRLHDALAEKPLWWNTGQATAQALQHQDLQLIDLIRPSSAPGRVYELRPSLAGRFKGAPYRSNVHGMRGAETPLKKPAGVLRIALLGDSHGFGWGIPQEDGFAQRMQETLDAAIPRARVEVLNFCVPGYNTAMEYACLDEVLAFDPNLIVVQYFCNDLYLPNFLLDEPEPPLLRALDLIIKRLGFATASPRLHRPRLEGEADNVAAAWRSNPQRVPSEYSYMVGYPGVEAALGRIRTVADAAQIPVAMMIFNLPRPSEITSGAAAGWRANRADHVDTPVVEMATRLGFHVIETVAPMVVLLQREGLTIRDIILSESDWHMNADGHRLIAAIVSDDLSNSGLLGAPGSPR